MITDKISELQALRTIELDAKWILQRFKLPDGCKEALDEIIRISRIRQQQPCEPNLGCATTRQLLEEIAARFDNLDYKTIDSD